MNDDVDAVLDRLLQVRRAERRVHDRHHSVERLSELPERLQIQYRDSRIGWRFSVQNLQCNCSTRFLRGRDVETTRRIMAMFILPNR